MIRILLAEDDTSMREYLQRALQRVGYDVESVGCGTEAMPLLEAGKYDLLLTDIVMPEMDGIELAQKASAIDPAIRVMFITGFAAVALMMANGFVLAVGAVLFMLLAVRCRREEAKLVERFGDEYRAYMARTWRFFPKIV